METIYELIKKHSKGKGEDAMWKATAIISDAIENYLPEDAKEDLYDDIYGLMSDGHYNEWMADMDIAKMYYIDESAQKHYAPYFTKPVIREHYEQVKSLIRDYNECDFAVALNMIASDYHNILAMWFPNATAEQRLDKYVELTVNWLADPDWDSKDKIWKYLH